MKTFWKIIGGILLFLIVVIIGLNIYFTNERLKNTVLPYLNDAVGRPVHVESMSLSFFTTFPHPGIEINNLAIPGKTKQDTLLSLNRLVAGIELFPIVFQDQLNITELVLNHPSFTYKIFADSTSNIDFLLNNEQTDTSSSGNYNINIPYFQISDGNFGYHDFTSNTSADLEDFDGDLSLSYADSIASSIDVEVGGLSATVDSLNYLNKLPLELTEESVIYPDREIIKLKKGTFAIRGLAMELTGALRNWSDAFAVDLQFNSSSDDFGELLRLVPENYADYTKNLDTKGSLDLGGTISGSVTGDSIPDFDIRMNVKNGYLKDPDLSEPIQNIQFAANATNKLITVDTLNAEAGANSVTGSGTLTDPLKDDGKFNMDFVADVDLSTVYQFYDITELGIETLTGKLNADANTSGYMNQPQNATFNGQALLTNGSLKYKEVPKAITNININASGTQNLLTLRSLKLQAGQNSFSAKGNIAHLLDENSRSIHNMDANLKFDLATIKNFYPINEDTLKLAGQLTAQATLDGKADQIEDAVQSGSINLKNGLIDYQKFDNPLRDITLESVLGGPQMTIVHSKISSGDNNIQASGVINNYLSDNRTVNLKTKGNAKLKELSSYYELKPDITDLDGNTNFNLNVKGQLNKPADMALSGKLMVKDANMSGEALREPLKDLDGTFSLSPHQATLNNLTFKMGSSDFDMSGSLSNYMEYLKDEDKRQNTPHLTGRYYSKFLDLDELIDWSDTTSGNYNLKLPDLNSSLSAKIDQMKITGVTMQNLQAKASATPKQINLSQAHVELFEGKADGTVIWKIPEGKPSTFHFKGSLDSLRLKSFFKEYPILGANSQFYKYITGAFSTTINYTTKITPELSPLIATTVLNGTFGMSKAQIENHPLQQKMASYTKINQLKDIALDKWKSTIAVNDNVLTIKDLSLTSSDIGLDLSGTQKLTADAIDFHVSLLLPGRFKKTIASVITSQAADALTRDNGTLSIPLRITGNYNNPKIQPDQTIIKPKIKSYLKNKAGNVLNNLFNRNKKSDQSKADSTQKDSVSN